MLSQATQIVETLQKKGYVAVFCGGCVRDKILGRPHSDIDIATNASPDVVESLFEKTLAVGKAFGVIVVVLGGYEIEVATFREDGAYGDGRRPDTVTFSSMEEDAKRRDLTINGMFYDPMTNEVIDLVGGQEDLKSGVIRLIGDPNARIAEDKLRMLRVIRFAARFNFSVVPETLTAVTDHAAEITQVSSERIADELIKILRTGNYKTAMDLLFETKLIDHILPEIKLMQGCEQPVDYHPEGDVLIHTVKALSNLPENASDELRMGVLLHDVGKPPAQTFEDRIRFNRHELKGRDIAERILKRLKFSNEFTEHVVCLVENHMKFMHVKDMRICRLKRFMVLPKFEEHMALHRADCLSSHGSLENYEFVKERLGSYEPEEIRPVRIINGHDLLALGFKQGPIFKTIMVDVEDRQLEGTITDREQALKYVAEAYTPA